MIQVELITYTPKGKGAKTIKKWSICSAAPPLSQKPQKLREPRGNDITF